MKRTLVCLAASAAILFAGFTSQAQPGGRGMPGMGGPGMRSEVSAAMMKLFGKTTAFTADAEMKMEQPGAKAITLTAVTAVLDGKMRSDIDMSALKGSEMPPQAVAQMKAMGMDKMATIFDPEANKLTMVYPNLKSYADISIPKSSGETAKEPKIEKTELGKETVDGHPTVKNKITITDESGKTHEMTAWNATDLKDFPIKFAMSESGANVEVLYKNIKLGKPDAKLFEAPSDFKKYDNFQQLMMENMQKMMGGGGAGKLPPGALQKSNP